VSPPDLLLLSSELVGDARVVRAAGEVDLSSANALEAELVATDAPVVVLDLGLLGYLDSWGIRAIERAMRRLRAGRRALLLVAPEDTVSAWTLRTAGFDVELLCNSVGDALALLDAPAERARG
jgi:anti-anti-sigma factor